MLFCIWKNNISKLKKYLKCYFYLLLIQCCHWKPLKVIFLPSHSLSMWRSSLLWNSLLNSSETALPAIVVSPIYYYINPHVGPIFIRYNNVTLRYATFRLYPILFFHPPPRGVLPYMDYIGTCRGIGYSFWGSRSLNRVSFFTFLFLCPWCGP